MLLQGELAGALQRCEELQVRGEAGGTAAAHAGCRSYGQLFSNPPALLLPTLIYRRRGMLSCSACTWPSPRLPHNWTSLHAEHT